MNVLTEMSETIGPATEFEEVLTEAGNYLAASLDYEATLAAVAELAVRSLADFCVIDIVEGSEVKRVQVAHADRSKTELTRELLRFPLDGSMPHLSMTALRTAQPVLVPTVTAELLDSMVQSPEHRCIVEALHPASLMAVPLVARERLLGVVLFVSSSRPYDGADLALAEKLVRLASLEVDNARLYGEAQRALRARDRVLGMVAHDLRSLLNAISMSAEVLLDPAFTEAQRQRQARLITRSALRMNRLIQDLLDIARIEADRFSLLREVQDPAALVEEAVEMNASLASARALTMTWKADGAVPLIAADRDRLLQVLSNLIGNAIKFTPEGGRIELDVRAADDGVRFSVSDTGAGISADDLSKLFQAFWQSQSGSLEGAGLGLMIAKGIVEAHGGRIWAESRLGEGTTFYFTVPAPATVDAERRRGPDDRRVREGRGGR